jgi:hypothetical protein
MLRWSKDLTLERDENGSTPLHFAAGMTWEWLWGRGVGSLVSLANKDALYQADNDGLYPIHVAASVGVYSTIASVGGYRATTLFLKECPGSAGLRDAKGRTFLYVSLSGSLPHRLVQGSQILSRHEREKGCGTHLRGSRDPA